MIMDHGFILDFETDKYNLKKWLLSSVRCNPVSPRMIYAVQPRLVSGGQWWPVAAVIHWYMPVSARW